MSALTRIAAAGRAHPVVVDVASALAVWGLALWSAGVVRDNTAFFGSPVPSWPQMALAVALTSLPLAARRLTPLSAMLACCVGLVVARWALDSQEANVTAVTLAAAFYAGAAHGVPRRSRVVVPVGLGIVTAWLAYEVISLEFPPGFPHPADTRVLLLATNLALFSGMCALGYVVAVSRRRADELQERSRQLAEAREEHAQQAVFAERVHIARELHDVLAHHISVMGVQAGAARMVLSTRPERATDALSTIEASSRRAVDEMQRMVGLLRRDDSDVDSGHSPPPGLSSIAELVDSDELTHVTFTVEGQERDVPETVGLSAYRVVQEALTNMRKHAHARQAEVILRYLPDGVEVSVRDDGVGGAGHVGSAGRGLRGMTERVRLHRGTIDAGPAPEGGWRVHAWFPLEPVAAP